MSATCPTCHRPLPAESTQHGLCPWCAWSFLGEVASTGSLIELPGLHVTQEIARGGMGVVYRATEAEAGREVAVKMMQPALGDDEDVRERFGQEARAMGALDHPGILPVYRVGDHHGLPFFTMKLAEGGTLAEWLVRFANDWRGIAELMANIAEAVNHAHQRGLLHRDLKPQNILFDAEGRAYVSDFGLVKMAGSDSSLTRSVSVIGTPHYMAPEVAQKDARAASIASDVWSLGAILYELMAQRLAFQAEGVPALLRKIVEEEPPSLANAPRDLATITMKCLHKNAAQRYATAHDLAEDLRHWLNGEPIHARPMSVPERAWSWCRRQPALAALSALLALSVIIGGTMIVRTNRELKQTLRASLLNEARSVHLAARVQERGKGLDAIRRAVALGVSQELEDEAASLLALPGVELEREFSTGRDWFKLIPNADLNVAADFSQPDSVRVVELPSRRVLAALPAGVPCSGMRECFTRDGSLLAFDDTSKGRMVVCEWRTGRVLREMATTSMMPCFSPDGSLCAVGSAQGSVLLYNLRQPELPPRELLGTGFVPALPFGFSPDGQWLAVGGAGATTMKVLPVESGKEENGFGRSMLGGITSVAWAGDSWNFITGTTKGKVSTWGLGGASAAARPLPSHSSQVYGAAIQPQGQLAVTSGFEGRSWLIDWPTGHAVGSLAGLSMFTRFSADGQRLAVHDYGRGFLQLYAIDSGKVCRQFVVPDVLNDRPLNKGSWSSIVRPGGRLLAVAQAGKTNLFDVASSRFLTALPEGSGNTLVWSADGRELWIAASPQKVARWTFDDQADGSIIAKRSREIALQGKAMLRLSLGEKADRWAISTEDGVCFGSIAKGDCTFIAGPAEFGSPMQTNALTLSPDGRLAIVSTEAADKLGVLDLEAQKWIRILDCDRSSYALFSADSSQVWIAHWSGLWRFDCRTWQRLAEVKDREVEGSLGFIDGPPGGRTMVTNDGPQVVLRDADGHLILRLRHPMPAAAAWLTMTADERWVVHSGLGYISQVWDLAAIEREFGKLGIPWRGRHYESAAAPRAVTRIVVE